MHFRDSSTFYLCVLLASLLAGAWARRGQDLHCGACRALVDELEWEISQVDPKKTIQIGSFRINPDGSQSVSQIPYARSEAHLTELLQKVCERMTEYGEKPHASTHRKTYVRVLSRDGTTMDLSGTKLDGDVTSSLKFACERIAEEYEDELIEFFSHKSDNVKDRLCSQRTGTVYREWKEALVMGQCGPFCALSLTISVTMRSISVTTSSEDVCPDGTPPSWAPCEDLARTRTLSAAHGEGRSTAIYFPFF